MKRYKIEYYLDSVEKGLQTGYWLGRTPEEAVGKLCWNFRGHMVQVDLMEEL